MPLFDQTQPLTPYNSVNAGVIPAEVFGIGIAFFANRTPLVSRLAKAPVGSLSFKITADDYRGTTTLGGGYTTTQTALTVADSSLFMPGDVVEVDNEAFLITAIASPTSLTVTFAYGGTTNANHSNGATVNLIGNSRNGAEVNQAGISRFPTTVEQYLQTFQHPYSVGGALASASNYALPPGMATPVDRDRMMAIQHCMDDMERSSYYGYGVQLAANTTKPAQKGLRSLITSNKTLSPTNASAYKPSDLMRDTLQPCYTAGGNPDVLLVSTDFLTGLAIWGLSYQYMDPGETTFGVKPQTIFAPFLGPVNVVPCPLLRSGTAICLTSGEARLRVKRAMFDKPRGSRGDAIEGDIIAEAAVELDNQQHHAWVSGITGFAKQS